MKLVIDKALVFAFGIADTSAGHVVLEADYGGGTAVLSVTLTQIEALRLGDILTRAAQESARLSSPAARHKPPVSEFETS